MTADMTDYEKMRAARHEALCRMTASLSTIRLTCRFRRCRRDRICKGPLVLSNHQALQVEVQRMIGLSGNACATLPSCVDRLPPRAYELFRKGMSDFAEDMARWPELDP